jgi:hypothetical protein
MLARCPGDVQHPLLLRSAWCVRRGDAYKVDLNIEVKPGESHSASRPEKRRRFDACGAHYLGMIN